MKQILFVCTSNTCRSPMAEAIMNKMLLDVGKQQEIKASSAGLYAFEGDPASFGARKAVHAFGASLEKHRARLVVEELVEQSTLIIAMARSHLEELVDYYPSHQQRMAVLKEFVGIHSEPLDILDPYNKNDLVYKQCAEEIHEMLSLWFKKGLSIDFL